MNIWLIIGVMALVSLVAAGFFVWLIIEDWKVVRNKMRDEIGEDTASDV